MLTVLVAPYLLTPKRLQLGDWEVIPRVQVGLDDLASTDGLRQVLGLLDLYHAGPRGRSGWGAVLRRGSARVGDPFPRSHVRPLHRALVASILDGNPTLDARRGDDPNLGHQVATSDNALLFGHRIQPDDYVSIDYGSMVTTFLGGLQIGDPAHAIAPPTELHLPLLGGRLDDVYADALFRCVKPRADAARRLGTAIDWLDLAWRNTPSVSFDTRVVQLKFGIEVLLDKGDDLAAQRSGLNTLLPDRAGGRRTRVFRTLSGVPKSVVMSDLEWWFSNFTWLRNKIAHGDEVTNRDRRWGRGHHIFIGERILRAAIKQTVAEAGYPEILMDPFDRIVRKHFGNQA